MAEEIKNLIEKIHQEGIKAAEDKAKDIEAQAQRRAQEIIAQAEKKTQKMLAVAQERIAQMEKSGRASLGQAGRDLLLSLREEIEAMLEKIVVSEVRQALDADELAKIIAALIQEKSSTREGAIVVSLKEKDKEKLNKGFLGKLADEAKEGIILKPSGEISGGFIISFDGGKSHFDFSDKAIAEYLSIHLKEQLAQLLKKAA